MQTSLPIPEHIEAAARRDGALDFKDEGMDKDGRSFGKLTLRSTTDPVYPDGRWVTRRDAQRFAGAWRVELFDC